MRKKAATDGAGVSYLRPRHRRCDRESLPSALGICADRRRAASVAQIIDIDIGLLRFAGADEVV